MTVRSRNWAGIRNPAGIGDFPDAALGVLPAVSADTARIRDFAARFCDFHLIQNRFLPRKISVNSLITSEP
jgi:hypothetical protein